MKGKLKIKKFVSISLLLLLFTAFPLLTNAQYNYKIIESTELVYIGGGIWMTIDHCYTGPGLCGPAIPNP